MVIMLGTEKDGRTTAIMSTAFASACATTESSQYLLPIPARARKLPYDHARYRERDRTERFSKRAAALQPAMANRRHLPCRSLPRLNFDS